MTSFWSSPMICSHYLTKQYHSSYFYSKQSKLCQFFFLHHWTHFSIQFSRYGTNFHFPILRGSCLAILTRVGDTSPLFRSSSGFTIWFLQKILWSIYLLHAWLCAMNKADNGSCARGSCTWQWSSLNLGSKAAQHRQRAEAGLTVAWGDLLTFKVYSCEQNIYEGLFRNVSYSEDSVVPQEELSHFPTHAAQWSTFW